MPAPFPSSAEAVAMPVDRLAMHVLWYLADTGKYDTRKGFILDRLREDHQPTPSHPGAYRQDETDLQTPPARAWAEAWDWLIARGLVSADLVRSDHWIISRHGRRIAAESEPLAHLGSLALIEADLHRRIASTVRSLFAQGLYDLAAFEAMKQVEIRVRELAHADPGDIGVPLMRQAFKPGTGPLADSNQEPGEQEATSALFAGAVGIFKNPTSHREVEFDDPTEASEVVLLADLLLRLLERRALSLSGR